MDNKHCQTRPQTAVMPFIYFNEYTPVIPKFYYDVYSLEEREKHIAKIIQKLMCYSDYLAQSLDDEIDNRAQEDTRLQEAIDAEADTRAQEDTRLQEAIDAEADTRAQEDTRLQEAIDAEAAARTQEDAQFQEAIDAEAATRAQEDARLQEAIDTVKLWSISADIKKEYVAALSYSGIGSGGEYFWNFDKEAMKMTVVFDEVTDDNRAQIESWIENTGTLFTLQVGTAGTPENVQNNTAVVTLLANSTNTLDAFHTQVNTTSTETVYIPDLKGIFFAPWNIVSKQEITPGVEKWAIKTNLDNYTPRLATLGLKPRPVNTHISLAREVAVRY